MEKTFWVFNPEITSHLDDRVSTGGCLDRAPAALGLIVGSVVAPRLHLDLQLTLAVLAGQGPIQRRQGGASGEARPKGMYYDLDYKSDMILLIGRLAG